MTTKTAIVKQIQGSTFAAKADSNHWVIVDGSASDGGSDAGSSPKEMLLFALGGCTAMDVVSILKKKRAPLKGLEIRLQGQVRDEHPRVFTSIHIEYVIYGDGINPRDVERAIELSTTKYCSVSAMVSKAATLTHSFRIVEPKVARVEETATTD
jgi:putative redox protein